MSFRESPTDPGREPLRIAIVSPNKNKYSETFIHAHITDLPGEKWLLHGGYLPRFVSWDLEEEDLELAWHSWWEVLTQRFGEEDQPRLEKGIKKWLQKKQIKVVLGEYGPSGVAMMDICADVGVPLVVHFHGYDAYREDILGEQGKDYPRMFAIASALVVVSEDMRRQLLSLGAPPEKVHLIPYGVDPELFRVTDPGENPPGLVAVGRFTAKKAPHLTIRAFAKAVKRVPEAQLTFAGEGDLLEECRALAEELGLGERVRFAGGLSQVEVAELLGGARAFVQHSLRPADGDSEGLPLAVLESMACGLPVVATRHAGIPDAVRHGEEGLLCEEGDVSAMAEHMVRVLEDPTYAARLGRAGAARVREHFTRELYLGRLFDLLKAQPS